MSSSRTAAERIEQPGPRTRGDLRLAALPTEHGGWGLTLEPGVLGLLVAPSLAGAALAVAALVAFLARTPLKLVLVDRWRRRRLSRTVVAERLVLAELVVLAGLVALAAATAAGPFWVPPLVAVPLVAVELWFDMRSRSRRLLPELAGTIGIGSVVAAIVLADGAGAPLAVALWLVVAGRATASLPFVRLQLARGKRRTGSVLGSDGAQVAAVALATGAAALARDVLAGLVAMGLVAALHVVAARRPPPVAKVLGIQETVLGVAIVLVTGLGVIAG